MVLAALVGGPLGAAAGIAAGNLVFKTLCKPTPVDFLTSCDQKADDDPDIPFPKTAGQAVSFLKQQLLKDTSPSLTQPDYDRALFINKLLTILWPHLSPAIHKEVMKQSRAPIQEALAKIPMIEDVRIDKLDLGEVPFRLDSFKSYQTYEDELILETPMFWGGDIKLRVTAVVKVGPATIDIPVDISDIQFKALARITIKPLVETLPCVGGVTISLLEEPTVNCDFRIGDGVDILALPGLPLAMKAAIKIVAGKMLLYPNEFSVPLMENFGLPPPPEGMLHVNVIQANNLKSSLFDKVDPYVTLEVREHRSLQTSTIDNNTDPVWNEELDFVVDDSVKQHLKVVVMDNDLVSSDIVGGALIELHGSEFMADPRKPVLMKIPLYAPDVDGNYVVVGVFDEAAHAAATPSKKKGLFGKLRKNKKGEPIAAPGPTPSVGSVSSAAGSGVNVPGDVAGPADDVASTASGATAPVVGRKKPPPGTLVGTLTLELTFYPFNRTEAEPSPADVAAAAAAAESGEGAAPTPIKRAVTSVRKTLQEVSFRGGNPKQKGVLTLYLKKVLHLGEATDTFVTIRLYDPHRLPIPDMIFQTRVELNEDCPRYNFKTDFVNISAASVLTLTVNKVPGLLDNLTSLKIPGLQKVTPKALGKVRLPLVNVVKEGRVKDVYPLSEAQTGEMHVTLEWGAIDFNENVLDDDEEEE